jgi:thiamine-monophosphate kinase
VDPAESAVNERELVARARELFSDRIGDDAAVVGDQVLTTDMLVEGVDFTRAIPIRSIARKSLAVNLSDLAAMGAQPQYALLGLALPPWAQAQAGELLEACAEMAREHRMEIVGGDFSRADKLTISVTAIGRVLTRPLLRSGAKRGDRIYLSRPVGGSAAGLRLLGVEGGSYAEKEFIRSAVRRQIDPEPEVALGMALARLDEVTACIDVSDGLSTDLGHLCDASGCGADIERERIPVFPDLQTHARSLGIDVREAVLHGGEEYALLFTSSMRESELSSAVGRPVYAIGRVSAEPGVRLDGEPLLPGGFDHFA